MPDITMCSPTRFMKKCEKCYRLKAEPSRRQSYSNFYDACKGNNYEYFMPCVCNDGWVWDRCPRCGKKV